MRKLTNVTERSTRVAVIALIATSLVACASMTAAPRQGPPSTDFVLVTVNDVSDPVTPSGGLPGGPSVRAISEAGSGQHMVEMRWLTANPETTQSVHTGHATLCSSDVCVADKIELSPPLLTVSAPSIVVGDGEEGSISLSENVKLPDGSAAPEDWKRARTTVIVTRSGGGMVDMVLSFEQRDAGKVVSDVPSTTIRLRDGQSALIRTRHPVQRE